jgi:hypothetical protein
MVAESLVFAIARSMERLLADTMFGVSLILGWNLFRVGIVKDQTAELSGKGWKVRLQRVGPGVFFALFGAAGLVVAIQKPLQETNVRPEMGSGQQTKASEPVPQGTSTYTVSYGEGLNSDTPEYITALTTVEDLGIRDDGQHSAEKDALLKAKPIIERHRVALLRNTYPHYDWYLSVKNANPLQVTSLSPKERKTYDELDEIVHKTLIPVNSR